MSAAKRKKIAIMGGHAQGKHNNPGNFANNPKRAASAGRKGGKAQGYQTNPSNFVHDRKRAAEAGRKGGTA